MAFIIAAVVSIKLSGLDRHLDQERLRTWISSYGAWGPIAYIILYSIAPSLMFPGVPITVAGGILFGPVGGTIYTSIGATIGASIAFLISRYLGRDWVEAMLKDRWKELDAKVERQGWKVVAFTRLIPLFPFNMLNYAFGLTRIRFSHYFSLHLSSCSPELLPTFCFRAPCLDFLEGMYPGNL